MMKKITQLFLSFLMLWGFFLLFNGWVQQVSAKWTTTKQQITTQTNWKKKTKTKKQQSKPKEDNQENAEVVGDHSNFSITVYSPTNMQYLFNWDFYNFTSDSEQHWYKSTIILPLAFLVRNGNNELAFQFRVEQGWKIHFVKVNMKFTPEMARKGDALIYIGKKDVATKDLPTAFQSTTLQSWDSNNIYIKTSNISSITLEDRADVDATILFPNLLGVRSYYPILVLWVVVAFAVFGFLMYKKDLVKI